MSKEGKSYMEHLKEKDKEIEKLNKGYCPIKEKCNKGECDCTNEEYNSMCEENIKLDLEIERLTISLQAQEELTMIWFNKVKKIREYIKEWQSFPHTNSSTHKELKNLMEIIDCTRSDKE